MAAFGALTALAAAAAWGGGDFSGGVGVKAAGGSTRDALRVVIVAHAVSLAAILVALWLWPSPWPHGSLLAWGLVGGCSQALSLTLFYMALARGAMGASAAVSGLIAAGIPAIASSLIEGVPAGIRLAGFALAAAAIWLIAAGPTPAHTAAEHRRITMLLAVIGGLGFGFFFLTMRRTNALGVFTQMALIRGACLVGCMAMLLGLQWGGGGKQIPSGNDSKKSKGNSKKSKAWLNRTALLGALGVALLDTGGNMLFTLATRLARLDVAAVLASLYPAGTILLAGWWLHERPTRRQGLGMAIALAAVVLITI
jgi:drug/metabolite transporter (DMT)-like permease